MSELPVALEKIARSILELRERRVILDRELAALYGVKTFRLNEAVKRNIDRFPSDFMFRLTKEEAIRSRSQFAILNSSRGGNLKYLPYAFTEHGAIQAANVLNSARAIAMGVHVVRAFVQLRDLLASNKSLLKKLDELEIKYQHHDKTIADMLAAIRQMLRTPPERQRGIGFTADID